jgi:NADH-quinone oxidoreductase subunit M
MVERRLCRRDPRLIMLLTVVTFLPVLGALLILALPRDRSDLVKGTSVAVTAVTFLASLPLYLGFNAASADYQFEEHRAWMPSLGISYHVGVDGLSVLLVLLTTFLTPLTLLSAWHAIESRWKEFAITMLLLETGMVGVFVALDLFLFYVFWEAMLVPMYLIIGIWGGTNRVYAAIKFVLYTLSGSLLMLVAILALYFRHGAASPTGNYTFDLPVLAKFILPAGGAQDLLFLAFALAFAIKVPMFPFHTWLPDAHVEAPTAGSVILAGVLLKMGTYGFLRFCLPLFPNASLLFTPWIFALAVIGIIYGAWVSTVQPDIKKLVAYSSVSHLGFVMLGLFTLTPQGLVGGIVQMVNHGLSTGALFLVVGMLYERRHTRLIAEFGGLWKVVPALSVLFLIVCLSSVGLPGLNGFVGEFLILLGAFQVDRLAAVLATTGIIFAAVYLLWMYQRVIFGVITKEANRRLPDLSAREWAILLPILALIVWIGVYPASFTGMTEASVQALITQVQAKAAAPAAAAIPVMAAR